MYCKYCGRLNDEDALFCKECGMPFNKEEQNTQEEQNQEQNNNKKQNNNQNKQKTKTKTKNKTKNKAIIYTQYIFLIY